MVLNSTSNLNIKHCVTFESFDCQITTATTDSGRIKCFLTFKEGKHVYRRNSRQGAWEIIDCPVESKHVRDLIDVAEGHIPTFNTRHAVD